MFVSPTRYYARGLKPPCDPVECLLISLAPVFPHFWLRMPEGVEKKRGGEKQSFPLQVIISAVGKMPEMK